MNTCDDGLFVLFLHHLWLFFPSTPFIFVQYNLVSMCFNITASMIALDACIWGDLGWRIQGNWRPRNQSEPTFGPSLFLALLSCFPHIPASYVTSYGASEANRTWGIEPRDQSGPKNPWDQFLGPQFCWIRHLRLLWMLKYNSNILAVSNQSIGVRFPWTFLVVYQLSLMFVNSIILRRNSYLPILSWIWSILRSTCQSNTPNSFSKV